MGKGGGNGVQTGQQGIDGGESVGQGAWVARNAGGIGRKTITWGRRRLKEG